MFTNKFIKLLCISFTILPFGQSIAQDNDGPSFEDLLNGFNDPTRWLTYSGDYSGRRHSPLTQITLNNVDQLLSLIHI